jgi:hypothetical protein
VEKMSTSSGLLLVVLCPCLQIKCAAENWPHDTLSAKPKSNVTDIQARCRKSADCEIRCLYGFLTVPCNTYDSCVLSTFTTISMLPWECSDRKISSWGNFYLVLSTL